MLNNRDNDFLPPEIHREQALKFIASSILELSRAYDFGAQRLNTNTALHFASKSLKEKRQTKF